jgi:hypothetical protein
MIWHRRAIPDRHAGVSKDAGSADLSHVQATRPDMILCRAILRCTGRFSDASFIVEQHAADRRKSNHRRDLDRPSTIPQKQPNDMAQATDAKPGFTPRPRRQYCGANP